MLFWVMLGVIGRESRYCWEKYRKSKEEARFQSVLAFKSLRKSMIFVCDSSFVESKNLEPNIKS